MTSVRSTLLVASRELSSRALCVASRWSLELLRGLCPPPGPSSDALENVSGVPRVSLDSEEEECVYSLSLAYMESREFARAAHNLDAFYMGGGGGLSPSSYPPRAFFLRSYALFLVSVRAIFVSFNTGSTFQFFSCFSLSIVCRQSLSPPYPLTLQQPPSASHNLPLAG